MQTKPGAYTLCVTLGKLLLCFSERQLVVKLDNGISIIL